MLLADALEENEALKRRVAELEARPEPLPKPGLSPRERLLIEAERIAHMGSWVWDTKSEDVLWSDELFRIFGRDVRADRPSVALFFECIHPDDLARVRERAEATLTTGVTEEIEFRVVRGDGSIRDVVMATIATHDDAGRISQMIGTTIDVTEKKRHRDELERVAKERARLESELLDAQKLEALGRLAGGVAHDFNNSLMVILANASLLARHRASAELTAIVDAAHGSASLTRQLLTFGRRALVAPAVISVTPSVDAAAGLARRVLGEDIELRLVLTASPWSVRLDAGSLQQMLLNLALNARDAMPIGGVLTLEVANVVLGAEHVRMHAGARLGEHVAITVSDTGIGMSAATRARALEPFFTTKPNGEGTGLGLAMVFGGVKQSGGSLTIDSAPGAGTRIRLFFPRADDAEADENAPRPVSPATLRRHHGDAKLAASGATVLVVEDDAAVARTIEQMLTDAGYDVRIAPCPSIALALASTLPGPVALVIADVILPEMNGPRLAEELRARGAAGRFLFVTGYDYEAEVSPVSLGPTLAKPFSEGDLLDAVSRLLHPSPSKYAAESALPAS